MDRFDKAILAVGVTAVVCAALIGRQVEEEKGAAEPRKFAPVKAGEEDKEAKSLDVDTVRAKRIVVKSKDGKSAVTITQAGDDMVGIWVTDQDNATVVLVAGQKGNGSYFGTYPPRFSGVGCPLAIGSDGTIQLSDGKRVKHITAATLFKLAK